MADLVEAGKIRSVGVSNFSRGAHAPRPRRPGKTRAAPGGQPGVITAFSTGILKRTGYWKPQRNWA